MQVPKQVIFRNLWTPVSRSSILHLQPSPGTGMKSCKDVWRLGKGLKTEEATWWSFCCFPSQSKDCYHGNRGSGFCWESARKWGVASRDRLECHCATFNVSFCWPISFKGVWWGSLGGGQSLSLGTPSVGWLWLWEFCSPDWFTSASEGGRKLWAEEEDRCRSVPLRRSLPASTGQRAHCQLIPRNINMERM